MPDHSDSDSSPKASSSSSSSSSSEEEKEEKAALRLEGSAAYPDPGSPSNAQQSSDESNNSDGVLVELPGQPDQDIRRPTEDPESGILVNIDGSVLEPPDDAGRDETFEDAPEDLAMPAHRRAGALEESMAVIEIGERSASGMVGSEDIALLQVRLDDALAECRRYKEEREVFGREIVSLRQQLQGVIESNNSQLETSKDEDTDLSSPTPLHSILSNCSKFVVDLKGILDHRLESESKMTELQATLGTKDKMIDDLTTRALESSVSHDVIISYFDSMRDITSESLKESVNAMVKRLLGSLEPVVGEESASSEGSLSEEISLLEKKTLLLVEKYTQFLSEMHQLKQCLVEVRPEFGYLQDNELDSILSFAREELHGSKTREDYFQEKFNKIEEENRKMAESVDKMRENLEAANAATNKTKSELEQAENKLLTAKEKLSIAVSKGKSLVQHRDSLKQSLTEKTSELERCTQELQQKSESLQANEGKLEELKQLLSEKTNELQKSLEDLQKKDDALEAARVSAEELSEVKNIASSLQESLEGNNKVLQEIEEVISNTDFPTEVLSMESVDKLRWLANQKIVGDIIILENQKIKNAISSIELPEDLSSDGLDSSIYWLSNSFAQAKNEITKLQDEVNGVRLALASHESKLFDGNKEIDLLKSTLMEETQAKSSLLSELEDLRYKYERIAENFSMVSSEKHVMMKLLLELSEITMVDEALADSISIAEKCIVKIREKMSAPIFKTEQIEEIQSFLYLRDLDLRICENILEVEMIDRSALRTLTDDELARVSEEVVTLRNERDTIQKELNRAEEKYSLLREKLSMAVKKGKGLVQEREGFKISLDEKSTEIEKLKNELQHKNSEMISYQEQIKSLSVYPEHIQKLESELILLKNQIDEIERRLHESNNNLQKLVHSLEKVILPTDFLFEEPMEKVEWISNYIQESEVAKANATEQLNKLREEAELQRSKLDHALTTIASLEEELSKAQNHISSFTAEVSSLQHGKASIEQELEKIKEENSLQAFKVAGTSATIKSLEDALSEAEKTINLISAEKKQAEDERKKENFELNAKLSEYKENLAGSLATLEKYRNGLFNHLQHLHIFSKDDSLLIKVSVKFNKMIDGLRSIVLLIQNLHNHLASKGYCLQPGKEHDSAFRKLSALPKVEDFITSNSASFETSTIDYHDISSLVSIVEGIYAQADYLGNYLEGLSSYVGDHIADTLQAFEATSGELVHVFELNESLKLNVENLEARNLAHEAKAASSKKEINLLASACLDATRELLTELDSSKDCASNLAQELYDWKFEESISTREDGSIVDEHVRTADNLLEAARKIRSHCQQLANAANSSLTAMEDMRNRLMQAELSAENAVQSRKFDQEKVLSMERDLEELKEVGNKMRTEIERYQAQEELFRRKEKELSSIQCALPLEDKGYSGPAISKEQMESLIDKVNKLEIPLSGSETQGQEHHLSSHVEKLFYVVDKVVDLQSRVKSLADEKEDMQLILASHLREIDNLKQVSAINISNYQELESRKADLSDVSIAVEKIIQKMGGYDLIQGQKIPTAKALLTVLERLTTALCLESENSKSKIQELAAKLLEKDNLIDEWSIKVKMLEDSIHSRTERQEIAKDRAVFEGPSTLLGSEISEIEDVGSLGKNSISSVPTAAHTRTMWKGSNDHLVLNIGSETEQLIADHETDDKGQRFKSLNTSGIVPKQGKMLADRIDGIWLSGGQQLMRRPRARLGLIAYWIFLHLWLLGTIL